MGWFWEGESESPAQELHHAFDGTGLVWFVFELQSDFLVDALGDFIFIDRAPEPGSIRATAHPGLPPPFILEMCGMKDGLDLVSELGFFCGHYATPFRIRRAM